MRKAKWNSMLNIKFCHLLHFFPTCACFGKIVTEWTVNPFCSFEGDCWTEIFLVTDKTEESNERKGVMSETASVVVLAFIIVESLIIVFANIFTIYVFWKHRTRLRRNCLLPLNLAFADLLVGSLEKIALGTSGIPGQFGKEALIISHQRKNNFFFSILTARSYSTFLVWEIFSIWYILSTANGKRKGVYISGIYFQIATFFKTGV